MQIWETPKKNLLEQIADGLAQNQSDIISENFHFRTRVFVGIGMDFYLLLLFNNRVSNGQNCSSQVMFCNNYKILWQPICNRLYKKTIDHIPKRFNTQRTVL